jgi:DNA-binding transcriptional LysR family regulator
MDIRHLKYFMEVARQKSFTRAAETLHVSQSAISKMIKDLEREVGLYLFIRSSKFIQLTDTGETFLRHTQNIVALFDNLILEVESAAKLDRGKITIGLPPITGSTRFAHLLGEFKKKFPDIDIALFEYGSKTIEREILNGSIDIGVICNSPDITAYHSFTLANDPLWVIASPSNPLSRLDEVTLAALHNEQFVMYREDFSLHQKIVSGCIAAGFQPRIIFETSQRELMTQIVATNLGVALMPSMTCAELDPQFITAIPLHRPQLYHQMSVIWKKERHLNRAAHVWIEFAQAYLTETAA